MSIKRFNGAGISGTKSIKVWDQVTTQNDYQSIATVVVPSGGSSTVSFTGIPQNFTHLQVRWTAASSRASYNDDLLVQFNNDTAGTTYSAHTLRGDGSSGSSVTLTTSGNAIYVGTQNLGSTGAGANYFGSGIMDILDYSNTSKYKITRTISGYTALNADSSGSYGQIQISGGSWYNQSNGISIITFSTVTSSSFLANTQFSLYGIKVAS